MMPMGIFSRVEIPYHPGGLHGPNGFSEKDATDFVKLYI